MAHRSLPDKPRRHARSRRLLALARRLCLAGLSHAEIARQLVAVTGGARRPLTLDRAQALLEVWLGPERRRGCRP